MARIKDILKDKGMTVQELFDKMNVSKQALSKQIQGKMLIETVQRIADSLEISIWQIFASPEDIKSDSNTLVCHHCGKPINIELKK